MHSYMLENFSMQQKCTHISLEKLAWPPRKFWAASGPGDKYFYSISMLVLQFGIRTCSTVTQFERLTIVRDDVTNASVRAGWKLLDEQLQNGLVSDLPEQ